MPCQPAKDKHERPVQPKANGPDHQLNYSIFQGWLSVPVKLGGRTLVQTLTNIAGFGRVNDILERSEQNYFFKITHWRCYLVLFFRRLIGMKFYSGREQLNRPIFPS